MRSQLLHRALLFCLLAFVAMLWPRPASTHSAVVTITADPNPVILAEGQTQGKTTLTWDGGDQHPYSEVWVKVDDNDETFVVESGKGKRDVTIDLGKTYLFKLSDANELLASVTVTAKQQAPAGGNPPAGSGANGRILTSGEKKKLDDVLNGTSPPKKKGSVFKGRHGSYIPTPREIVRLDILGGGGGSFFEYVCGADSVLVGIRSYTGLWIDNVQAVCAHAVKDHLEDAQPEGPVFGGAAGQLNNSFNCPSQTIAAYLVVSETRTRSILGAMKFGCLDFFTRQLSGYEHYSYGMRGGDPMKTLNDIVQTKEESCPPNTVAVGIRGRAGTYLDGFGLICAVQKSP